MICFDDTLGCLDVEALEEDVFTAPNIPMPYYRIFGGQLLAQCIAIATRTTAGKHVKSIHVAFPREGDLKKPVRYRVQRTQDGRTFAGRLIIGEQEGRTIVTASVSLHITEEGLAHQVPAPAVPRPESCPVVDHAMIPWETRVVGGVDLASREAGPASYQMWMRAPALPEDPAVHQALFAHATDLTLIGTTLRPIEGIGQDDSPERIHTAVTTHTLWFHRPIALDDWVLLSQESPGMAGGRGFAQGHAFSQSGDLLASFAQESMIRGGGRRD
jgi:acyl-CoA thioesterase-2